MSSCGACLAVAHFEKADERRRVPINIGAMITFKEVLCPIDLSEASSRPLTYAAAFARWYDARLTVLHIVPTFDPMQVHAGFEEPVRIVYPMAREEVIGNMRRVLE